MSRIKSIVPEEVDEFDELIGSVHQTLIISDSLATLNEHDNANRVNRFAGAALKKRMTELVASYCGSLSPITHPVVMDYEWYISGRHDYDNVAFARKYVQDGLVHAGKIPNDNQKWIVGFTDSFYKVAKGEEKIVVTFRHHLEPPRGYVAKYQ